MYSTKVTVVLILLFLIFYLSQFFCNFCDCCSKGLVSACSDERLKFALIMNWSTFKLFFQQYLWFPARLQSWQSWVSCFSFFIRSCHFSLGSSVSCTFCFTIISTILLNIFTSSFILLNALHICLLLFNLQPLLLLVLPHALILFLTILFTSAQYSHTLPVVVSGNWQCTLNPHREFYLCIMYVLLFSHFTCFLWTHISFCSLDKIFTPIKCANLVQHELKRLMCPEISPLKIM